ESPIVGSSHDLPGIVYPRGLGPSRAGHVERGVVAMIEQEVSSHDLARVVYPAGAEVERGVPALIVQEAVTIAGSIDVRSHDLARGIYPVCLGTWDAIRAGRVERDVAALIVQEAVLPCSIGVIAHDLARGIYPAGPRISHARPIERGVVA